MFRKTVPAADSAIVGFIDSYNVRIKRIIWRNNL